MTQAAQKVKWLSVMAGAQEDGDLVSCSPGLWALSPWTDLGGILQATWCKLTPSPPTPQPHGTEKETGAQREAKSRPRAPSEPSCLQGRTVGSYSGEEVGAWSSRAVPEEEVVAL